jgi:hypothetical protein
VVVVPDERSIARVIGANQELRLAIGIRIRPDLVPSPVLPDRVRAGLRVQRLDVIAVVVLELPRLLDDELRDALDDRPVDARSVAGVAGVEVHLERRDREVHVEDRLRRVEVRARLAPIGGHDVEVAREAQRSRVANRLEEVSGGQLERDVERSGVDVHVSAPLRAVAEEQREVAVRIERDRVEVRDVQRRIAERRVEGPHLRRGLEPLRAHLEEIIAASGEKNG